MRSEDKSIAKEGSEDSGQCRPVFKYFEEPKPEHHFPRTFKHAYMLVGEDGKKESFEESSKVTQFDREGSKTKPECAMADPEEHKVADLPPGKSQFIGWTTNTDEEIHKKGAEITGSDPYNIVLNNCADFAEKLSDAAVTTKGDERLGEENISTHSPFIGTAR